MRVWAKWVRVTGMIFGIGFCGFLFSKYVFDLRGLVGLLGRESCSRRVNFDLDKKYPVTDIWDKARMAGYSLEEGDTEPMMRNLATLGASIVVELSGKRYDLGFWHKGGMTVRDVTGDVEGKYICFVPEWIIRSDLNGIFRKMGVGLDMRLGIEVEHFYKILPLL
ncbi:hypothetical protein A2379_02795 [Candidatus Amesbacteria bacterium RIFOXYB1_FULL_47_13]|nr:MAG: hypothetical protein A2379_02795 [Candidatus Amesbacteria bacterium RIFOXYB1_FULL_47_13]HBC72240.1 hypothetical protein [Candidatus Amesbacteria bacterium]